MPFFFISSWDSSSCDCIFLLFYNSLSLFPHFLSPLSLSLSLSLTSECSV
ncbi:hypothetical protein Hanom_Chr07g00664721 [Helianthus anomalus]